MSQVIITRKYGKSEGDITLPLSKSITNRLLILAHLMKSPVNIDYSNQPDDIILMDRLLTIIDEAHFNEISDPVILDCKNAGTVLRFLTAVCALKPGRWILTGNERMMERPVGILVDALRRGGAKISYTGKNNYPPVLIEGGHWKGGDAGLVESGTSSQFLSAILLAGAFTEKGIRFKTGDNIVSRPYFDMTAKILGNSCKVRDNNEYCINKAYDDININKLQDHLEADWSAASYFYSLAALSEESSILLKGIHFDSIQGDSVIRDIYKIFGVISEEIENGVLIKKEKGFNNPVYFEYDLSDYPDIAPAIAVTCAGLGIETRLTGLKSLKIKESDRLDALQEGFFSLGILAHSSDDSIYIPSSDPTQIRDNVSINTFGDHRIAMAFAPLAMVCGVIKINGPEVVEKSFPAFWNELEKILCLYQYHNS